MNEQNTGSVSQPQVPVANKPTVLPGPIQLLSESWAIFIKRMWTLWGISLLIGLSFVVFMLAITLGSILSALFAVANLYFVFVILEVILAVGLSAAFLVFVFWAGAANYFVVKNHEEKMGIGEAFRQSWPKLNNYAWVMILSGLITSGGFILLIIPGIVFSVWFYFAALISLFENEKGMNALLKSREYVRARWWGIFWRVIFISAILWLVSVLFSILHFPQYVSTILSFLYSPLMIVYMYLLYKYAKESKGEFAFTPTAGQKNIYIIISVVGILILAAIIAMVVYGISQLPPNAFGGLLRAATK
jgi:hypothetical protein